MARVFLSLGSNLPDRLRNLKRAGEMIAEIPKTRVRRGSHVYETAPVGDCGEDFLNCVLEVTTELSPPALLQQLQEIERQLGRREPRAAPRIIDIDILLFGDTTIESQDLKIPHPRMHERRFVLQPLSDIAPELSIKGRSVEEWLVDIGDRQRVVRLSITQ